ncbi:uncharacterized protein SGFS_053180 [Streptomyces graminofaciens]|uniref:Uncharacterized protein n=2 Tax=Streptomyces graminofaciens TaxID=68212 RepID=A0ABN5VKR9_9ACTN|nr:uncharacterized protein SGFS_053180 [Streptomyces graminofaciens]
MAAALSEPGLTVQDMAIRPSARWRARVDEEATELAEGTRAPSDVLLSELFPESLLAATDKALRAFELDVEALRDQDDEQVFEAIKRVVLVLNEINEDHDGAGYETEEREELCLYIDQTLMEHGTDVPALAARRGISRTEITDDWRDW